MSVPPAVPLSNPPTVAPVDDPQTVAYLAALDQAGVPVGANRAVVLSIGRGVCRQRNEPAEGATVAGQVTGLFPGVWTPQQARTMVNCAAMYFC